MDLGIRSKDKLIYKLLIFTILLFPFCVFSEIDNFETKQLIIEKTKDSLINNQLMDKLDKKDQISVIIDFSNFPTINNANLVDINVININKRIQHFSAIILYYDSERNILKTNFQGRYDEYITIPSFNKRMNKNTIITESDLTTINISTSQLTDIIITDSNDLIGKAPKNGISSNIPITKQSITNPLIIKKGDLVTAYYQNQTIIIKATATALEDGAVGSNIKMRNIRSNNIIAGIVMDKGKVMAIKE